MSPTQNPEGGAQSGESPDDQVSPVPDQDGPHDVPDDEVIEKTLPAPAPASGDRGDPPQGRA